MDVDVTMALKAKFRVNAPVSPKIRWYKMRDAVVVGLLLSLVYSTLGINSLDLNSASNTALHVSLFVLWYVAVGVALAGLVYRLTSMVKILRHPDTTELGKRWLQIVEARLGDGYLQLWHSGRAGDSLLVSWPVKELKMHAPTREPYLDVQHADSPLVRLGFPSVHIYECVAFKKALTSIIREGGTSK